MMIDRAERPKLIAVALLAIVTIVLVSLVYTQSRSRASVTNEPNSLIGDDSEVGSASWLRLENEKSFTEAFPASLHTSILNVAYKRHYELYGEIARSASLRGSVTNPDKEGYKKFTLLMGENKNQLEVRVKVNNIATNDLDVKVEKGK